MLRCKKKRQEQATPFFFLFFFFCKFPRVLQSLLPHNLSDVVLNFAICDLHPVSLVWLPLSPSLSLWHLLSNHLCVCSSRWTPSTWVSWSFSGRPGWSSCWDRATPSAFCYGPSYSHSRSNIIYFYLFIFATQGAMMSLTKCHKLWEVFDYVFAVPSLTGSSLCLPSNRHAFLHICHNWNAGIVLLTQHYLKIRRSILFVFLHKLIYVKMRTIMKICNEFKKATTWVLKSLRRKIKSCGEYVQQ